MLESKLDHSFLLYFPIVHNSSIQFILSSCTSQSLLSGFVCFLCEVALILVCERI